MRTFENGVTEYLHGLKRTSDELALTEVGRHADLYVKMPSPFDANAPVELNGAAGAILMIEADDFVTSYVYQDKEDFTSAWSTVQSWVSAGRS